MQEVQQLIAWACMARHTNGARPVRAAGGEHAHAAAVQSGHTDLQRSTG